MSWVPEALLLWSDAIYILVDFGVAVDVVGPRSAWVGSRLTMACVILVSACVGSALLDSPLFVCFSSALFVLPCVGTAPVVRSLGGLV